MRVSSESEMEKWMEDLKMAVDLAEESDGLTSDLLMSNKHISKSHVYITRDWSALSEKSKNN